MCQNLVINNLRMEWQILFWLSLAALCLGSDIKAERKVEFGSRMHSYYSPVISSAKNVTVNAIENDRYLTGNVLAAIGSAVYSVDEHGRFSLVVGNATAFGYDTWLGHERFNEIAGMAQTSSGLLVVADKNNQCLRKINRYTAVVETYAGECAKNKWYDKYSYRAWKTFNSPTTLHYDSSRRYLYVLDVLEAGSEAVIVYNNVLYPDIGEKGKYTISIRAGYLPTDFFYNEISSVFFIVTNHDITTAEWKSGQLIPGAAVNMSGIHSIAASDDILVGSNTVLGNLAIHDKKTGDSFKLCEHYSTDNHGVVCILHKPTAVAIFNGYMYVGSTTTMRSGESKAILSKLSFSVSENFVTTKEPTWDWKQPTWKLNTDWKLKTTTGYSFDLPASANTENDLDDFSSSENDDDYSSTVSRTNSGSTAIIVVACVAGVFLKFCLIGWRISRCRRRVVCRRVLVRTTSRAVSSTRSSAPYERLQESAPPAGQFPTPPPYTPPVQTQNAQPESENGQNIESQPEPEIPLEESSQQVETSPVGIHLTSPPPYSQY